MRDLLGGGRYDEALMSKVTAPIYYAYGEKDHGTQIDRVFAMRDERQHRHNLEAHLVKDMPHGWMNDTIPAATARKRARRRGTV